VPPVTASVGTANCSSQATTRLPALDSTCRICSFHRHGFQAAVHERDGGRALSHRGGDPFDRSLPHIAGRERPGQAGLERQRRAAGAPAASAAAKQVRPGEDEAPLVTRDAAPEPFRLWLRADEDEQGVGRDTPPCSGFSVLQHQRFEMIAACAANHLDAVGEPDAR
jgi:hypothetical protein